MFDALNAIYAYLILSQYIVIIFTVFSHYTVVLLLLTILQIIFVIWNEAGIKSD